MSRRLFQIVSITSALWAASGVSAQSLSDPTRPAVLPVAAAPERDAETAVPLDLQAILFAEGRRLAIVNDQRVGVDDLVLSARVIEIGRRHVLLSRDGETIELELVTQDVKKSRSAEGIEP